jgi:hypothetical protein
MDDVKRFQTHQERDPVAEEQVLRNPHRENDTNAKQHGDSGRKGGQSRKEHVDTKSKSAQTREKHVTASRPKKS